MTSCPIFKEGNTTDTDTKSTSISMKARLAGNKLLKRKNHNNFICQEALSYFSKSIAYALPNSEELTLAYNNRSVLLLHLKKYDFCLHDIERALNSSRPESELHLKLVIRKLKCLKSLGRPETESVIDDIKQWTCKNQHPQTSHKLNDSLEDAMKAEVDLGYSLENESLPKIDESIEVPRASSAIEMKYNSKFGRHLIVNRDVSTGEVLLIEEAFVGFPTLDKRYLVCSNCLNFAWTAVPCSYCPCVVYCSTFCKDDAWKRYHDIECGILQNNLISKDYQTRFVMVLRSFILALKEGDSKIGLEHVIQEAEIVEKNSDGRARGFVDGRFLSNRFRSFYSLESHVENIQKMFINQSNGKADMIETLAVNVMKIFERTIWNESIDSLKKSPNWCKLKDVLIKIFCIILLNNYLIQSSDSMAIVDDLDMFSEKPANHLGNVLAPAASLVNHSCHPNVSRLFKDGKIIVFSTCPIKKYDQIYINYGAEITRRTCERKLKLKTSYFFDCSCLCCEKDFYLRNYDLEMGLFYDWMMRVSLKIKETCEGETSISQFRKKVIP